MREDLEAVLRLQPLWDAKNTPEMAERGLLLRGSVRAWLADQLPALAAVVPSEVDDLRVEARDATGQKAEIPWARVHSASRSPSATEGWYVVYLFSADGAEVYLSLNQASTRWENGEYRSRPPEILAQRAAWAQALVGAQLATRPDALLRISLRARRSKLGPQYEVGNVAAFRYAVGAIPSDATLEADLRFMVAALGAIYIQEDHGLRVPGEPAPEVADVLTAIDVASGRRRRRAGFRLSVKERLAIERRAVDVASEYLGSQGYDVKDVGSTKSYDLHATRQGEVLYVEVKGTTSDGEEVILTKGEVDLHRQEYPHNRLMIVSRIQLDRSGDPTASGGELRVIGPWSIEEDDLAPLAYRYSVPRP